MAFKITAPKNYLLLDMFDVKSANNNYRMQYLTPVSLTHF